MFSLQQATKAERGEQMYSCALPSTSELDEGGGGQRQAPAAFTPRKDPLLIV